MFQFFINVTYISAFCTTLHQLELCLCIGYNVLLFICLYISYVVLIITCFITSMYQLYCILILTVHVFLYHKIETKLHVRYIEHRNKIITFHVNLLLQIHRATWHINPPYHPHHSHAHYLTSDSPTSLTLYVPYYVIVTPIYLPQV